MKQRTCPSCKAPLMPYETTCPNCKAEVPLEQRKGPRCVCGACGKKFRAAPGAAMGSAVDCPECGQEVQVPWDDRTLAPSAGLESTKRRTRRRLGAGWDTIHDALDRVYFYGCVAGFILIAWLTCAIVAAAMIFIPFVSAVPWMPYLVLTAISAFVVRRAIAEDEDLRPYLTFIVLGWAVAVPVVGLLVLLAIFGLGFFVLAGSSVMASIHLLKCLSVPAETRARPFIIGTIASLLLGVVFFAGGAFQGLRNLAGLMQPNEVPYLQEFLLSGILLTLLGNCLFAVFLRLIPNVFADKSTGEYVTNYLVYIFAFAVGALLLTWLIVSGVLVSEQRFSEQLGPSIAWIVFVTLGSINIAWLLKCVSAARDDIRPHFRG
jgi:hypothetical protein